VRQDPELLRQALASFHMVAPPNEWARKPAVLGKAASTWIAGRFRRDPTRPGQAGPKRGEMFADLGLPLRADLDRVRSAAA
jgi:hypothetical protein